MKIFMVFLVLIGILTIGGVIVIAIVETRLKDKNRL